LNEPVQDFEFIVKMEKKIQSDPINSIESKKFLNCLRGPARTSGYGCTLKFGV
jgi:hypothetical protein